jgi:integrase
MYRTKGRLRRHALGSYPRLGLADARDAAKTALAEAQLGKDPAGEKRREREADTFGELAETYIERHAKINKRTWKQDQRILDYDLSPAWRSRKVAEISRRDVTDLLDRISARGAGIMANRTRALVSKLFNFAIQRGVTEINPAYRVPRPTPERQRDRVLSETEIRALWVTLDQEPPRIASVFRLALLTAQRRGDVLGLKWDELDLEAGWWTLPASRSKNKLAHRVPLGPKALDILKGMGAEANRSEFVFPGVRGLHLDSLQKPMRRIKKTSGVNFKFHGLRRTAASHMTAIGIERLVVSKILNHVENHVTAVYDRHSYDPEKRTALLKWEQRLDEIASEPPAKILEHLAEV